jgi:hypothetical protein
MRGQSRAEQHGVDVRLRPVAAEDLLQQRDVGQSLAGQVERIRQRLRPDRVPEPGREPVQRGQLHAVLGAQVSCQRGGAAGVRDDSYPARCPPLAAGEAGEELSLVEQAVQVGRGQDAGLPEGHFVDPACAGDRAGVGPDGLPGLRCPPQLERDEGLGCLPGAFGDCAQARPGRELLQDQADHVGRLVVDRVLDEIQHADVGLVARRHGVTEPELPLVAAVECCPQQVPALRQHGYVAAAKRQAADKAAVDRAGGVNEAQAVRPEYRQPGGPAQGAQLCLTGGAVRPGLAEAAADRDDSAAAQRRGFPRDRDGLGGTGHDKHRIGRPADGGQRRHRLLAVQHRS